MVRHAIDGWVCPDVTPASIAEGLVYFLSDPERARRAGDQALESERIYNRDRFSAAWAEVFSAEQDMRTSRLHTQPS
jgi:glycosyltransferase involved in cell wall biosynthesis